MKTWTSVKFVGGLHSLSMEFSFVEFNLCTSREGWALAEWVPQAHSFPSCPQGFSCFKHACLWECCGEEHFHWWGPAVSKIRPLGPEKPCTRGVGVPPPCFPHVCLMRKSRKDFVSETFPSASISRILREVRGVRDRGLVS